MPKPCFHWFKSPYAASHNPPPYYTRLGDSCAEFDVSLRNLQADLDGGTLPAFSFIMPNMCNSTHNCALGTGDAWVAHMVRRLVASPAYQTENTAIFVTFDEGENSGSDNCARNEGTAGCRFATFVVSPYTAPHARSATLFNHYSYSLLRTTEEMLGVPTLLGKAKTAASMRAAFDL